MRFVISKDKKEHGLNQYDYVARFMDPATVSAGSQALKTGDIVASSVIIDVVASQTVGKIIGNSVKSSRQASTTGKNMQKGADRTRQQASGSERANNYGEKSATTASGEVSATPSSVVEAIDKKEKNK